MNAVSQLLLILAIVGAIAAGALFYMSGAKVGGAAQQTDSTMSTQLKDAQTKLAAAQAEAAKDAQALADEKQTASLADNTRDQAVAALDDANKKARDATNAASDKDAQIADLTTKAASVDDLNKQIADLKDQLSKAQTQPVADASKPDDKPGSTTNGKTDKPVVVAPPPVQLTPAAPAQVLEINTKQWLIVLNVGTKDGVQKDSTLQLKVGNTDVGSVVVRDSKDGLSTGAITSTGGISLDDYSKIVKKDLTVQYQRVM